MTFPHAGSGKAAQGAALRAVAVHALLYSGRPLGGVPHRLFDILSRKRLLARTLGQMALVRFPVPTGNEPLPRVHHAHPFERERVRSIANALTRRGS